MLNYSHLSRILAPQLKRDRYVAIIIFLFSFLFLLSLNQCDVYDWDNFFLILNIRNDKFDYGLGRFGFMEFSKLILYFVRKFSSYYALDFGAVIRIINIFFASFSSMLLFLLFSNQKSGFLFSIFLALLFITNPFIANISTLECNDVMASGLVIMSLYFYYHPDFSQSKKYLIYAGFFYTWAILTREQSIIYFLLFFLKPILHSRKYLKSAMLFCFTCLLLSSFGPIYYYYLYGKEFINKFMLSGYEYLGHQHVYHPTLFETLDFHFQSYFHFSSALILLPLLFSLFFFKKLIHEKIKFTDYFFIALFISTLFILIPLAPENLRTGGERYLYLSFLLLVIYFLRSLYFLFYKVFKLNKIYLTSALVTLVIYQFSLAYINLKETKQYSENLNFVAKNIMPKAYIPSFFLVGNSLASLQYWLPENSPHKWMKVRARRPTLENAIAQIQEKLDEGYHIYICEKCYEEVDRPFINEIKNRFPASDKVHF